ncbi:hypothetical protein KDA_19840 [Dictyobacter alpinus]|uniref:Uncharacterized protein n=1 Tax=Dictyobacter alpinus TaxID=2014873 RepID=A0A402B578_9CHLR|nr:hypothetical protein KDA_19840 [Dictyobacter alpinus]
MYKLFMRIGTHAAASLYKTQGQCTSAGKSIVYLSTSALLYLHKLYLGEIYFLKRDG